MCDYAHMHQHVTTIENCTYEHTPKLNILHLEITYAQACAYVLTSDYAKINTR